MAEKIKNIQSSALEVRGKHFKILKNQFLLMFSFGIVHLLTVILDSLDINSVLVQNKKYVFLITIPIILTLMMIVLKKLYLIQQRTKNLVSYVDQIVYDENKFRTLFEGAIDGHALIDPYYGIIECNDSFKNMLKLPDQYSYMLSKYFMHNYRLDINSSETYEDFIQEAQEKGSAIGYWQVKDFEGNIVPAKISLRKFFNANKNLFMLSIHDETENEQRQNQLKKITVKAVEATKAKSEFLANMTHELRTPLNGIIGISDILLLSKGGDTIKEDLSIINSSGKSLLSLINNVLDYSKLDAQKVVLESLPISTHDLIDTLKSTFKNITEKKGLTFNIDVEKSIPEFFMGDKLRLQQVLINLISNAIKFTTSGGVTLKIKLEKEKGYEQITVVFYILDTGIGIPEDSITKLFNSFEQVDNTTTRKFGGTGLGLSISKQILALMESHIDVESELGKGSCFSFKISTKRFIKTTTRKDVKGIELIELQPLTLVKKILIAEDNKINQIVAKKYLNRLGFKNITLVEDGKQALEMTIKNKYDYVFMDMQMPIMDGVTATERIYEELHFLDTPIIIAMTANNTDEDKKICSNAGMLAFLTKPLNIDEIKEIFFKFEANYHDAA